MLQSPLYISYGHFIYVLIFAKNLKIDLTYPPTPSFSMGEI